MTIIEFTPAIAEVTATLNGTVLFVPLNKLKKSPRNARKAPHSEAHIEALAASIAAKGLLQNLVVEPETDAAGEPTGSYFVTIGEGRRLAYLLRAKRKQIKKTEPVRCVLDIANDPREISLDENVTREAMHPADQFERFRELAESRGWGAEEIAARFGVSAQVVRQRLRLGAVSPKLMQLYRDGELTLDQLMAFAITEEHERQEQVYANLSWNRDPWAIRRDLTKMHVAANDRRAIFVGAKAYAEAGGSILRDLFSEDRGGYFEDVALLDGLVLAKLEAVAAEVQALEGWKWSEVHVDFPHAHGMRRVYPGAVDPGEAEQVAYDTAVQELEQLTAAYDTSAELPDEVGRQLGELEAEIARIDAMRYAYDAEQIAAGGVLVVLSHDGRARVERGFIRSDDEKLLAEETEDARGETGEAARTSDSDAGEGIKPLSDVLVRDLTAHRTLGLRLALGEHPQVALIAVTHALASQAFYRGGEASCLEIRSSSVHLASHADGIEDSSAAKALADRHAGWASDLPRDVADLWAFVVGLDYANLIALLAHCASLTVNAVKLPGERKPNGSAMADALAAAVSLDMAAHWTPTERSYLGRVTKAHVLQAVSEAVGAATADRLAGMKKGDMVASAEQLLAGSGWVPVLLRTAGVARTGLETEVAA